MIKFVLCIAAFAGVGTFANETIDLDKIIPARPELHTRGRNKHGSKPSDDIEKRRKIFTFWDKVPGAIKYEVCH